MLKKEHNSLKFKLPDIIRGKGNKLTSVRTNLNGSFDVVNDDIKNIEVFSKHKYFSTFIEGRYNIKTQNSDVSIWGKYNKTAQQGIRILFIPLSWVTKAVLRPEKTRHLYPEKINKIPAIEATEKQLEIFRVKINGDINSNSKMKFEMHRLY